MDHCTLSSWFETVVPPAAHYRELSAYQGLAEQSHFATLNELLVDRSRYPPICQKLAIDRTSLDFSIVFKYFLDSKTSSSILQPHHCNLARNESRAAVSTEYAARHHRCNFVCERAKRDLPGSTRESVKLVQRRLQSSSSYISSYVSSSNTTACADARAALAPSPKLSTHPRLLHLHSLLAKRPSTLVRPYVRARGVHLLTSSSRKSSVHPGFILVHYLLCASHRDIHLSHDHHTQFRHLVYPTVTYLLQRLTSLDSFAGSASTYHAHRCNVGALHLTIGGFVITAARLHKQKIHFAVRDSLSRTRPLLEEGHRSIFMTSFPQRTVASLLRFLPC